VITKIAIAVIVALIIAYDVVALLFRLPTISLTLLEWSREYPVIPLAIGIPLGHVFWPNKE
jgi:hypothetical protein